MCALFLFGKSNAQTGDGIFNAVPASIGRDKVNYSPVFVKDNWYYTAKENEAVVQHTVGSQESKAIVGMALKQMVVTGFSRAGASGLIAISIGPATDIIRTRVKGNKIWFAHEDKSGFMVKYFEFALNSDSYSCTTPFITPDGTQMYFASDMPGGYGGFDLYVCDYRGQEWTKPRNLGPKINTPKDELFPFKDQSMLFFSSNGHSDGGMDILLADIYDNKARLVFNPGAPINTKADDYAMTYDTRNGKGYLVSDRTGTHGQLYSVDNIKKILLVNVREFGTKKPLGGTKIDLARCRRTSVYTNSAGSVILPVSGGENCFMNIEKVGYTNTFIKMDYNEIKGLASSMDIMLSPNALFYEGTVVDQTGSPAPEVQVSMVDQATGDLQITFTDDNGKYSFAMEPLSYYLIRIENEYYKPFSKKIKTSASFGADVLGQIKLEGTGKPAGSMGANIPAETKPVDTSNEIRTVEATEVKAPVITPIPENSVLVFQYALQLAAVAGKITDLSKYQSALNGLGTVYTIEEDNMSKIRLGTFNSRDEANAIRRRLPAEYKNSFIVTEEKRVVQGGNSILNENIKTESGDVNARITDQPKPVMVEKKEEPKEKTPEVSNSGMVKTESEKIITKPPSEEAIDKSAEYKIRLSTLRDSRLFDASKIKQYGLVEEVKSGNLTIFYLSGFGSKDEAKEALPKIQAAGFTTAHLVKLKDGIYSKVD